MKMLYQDRFINRINYLRHVSIGNARLVEQNDLPVNQDHSVPAQLSCTLLADSVAVIGNEQ